MLYRNYKGLDEIDLSSEDAAQKIINYARENSKETEYEDIEIIVSSLRIDTVISRLIYTNRNNIKNLINKKEIILNYNPLSNNSYLLKENDIFSIRKYGKYKFIGIIKNTKKDVRRIYFVFPTDIDF